MKGLAFFYVPMLAGTVLYAVSSGRRWEATGILVSGLGLFIALLLAPEQKP